MRQDTPKPAIRKPVDTVYEALMCL